MQEVIRPPSTILMGPAGTGKTTACATAVKAGLSLRMIATESSAPNRVISALRERSLPIEKFDWMFVSPAMPSWDSLKEAARIINTNTLKDIADMRSGIAKQDGMQWMKFLDAHNNFVSARTGQSLGDISDWDDSVMLVHDGLTGMSEMARALVVGLKPNPAPGEWGVMQGAILNVVTKLANDCRCFYTLIAHVEREMNELTGMQNVTVSTLGAKLAPKLPPKFTSVVLSRREGANFSWSTAATNTDTKNGDLAFSDSLPQDFGPLVEAYRLRKRAVQESGNVEALPDTQPKAASA